MTRRVHPADVVDGQEPCSPGRDSDNLTRASNSFADVAFRIVQPATAISQPMVIVWGKKKKVCLKSLFLFPIDSKFRQKVLLLVEWLWFDRFILFLILVNSILITAYQWQKPDDQGYNKIVNDICDPILTALFTVELVLKVLAWGFFMEKNTYLRDPWNWLDFIVVISALVAYIPQGNLIDMNFLRVFRVLRPLRSLNKVPQMKVLVNTVLTSIPRLGNVSVMGAFLFVIFAIVGVTLMDGIFYRSCRATPEPELDLVAGCWRWAFAEDDRLCGGHYMCEGSTGICRGHEEDSNPDLRPTFPGGRRDYDWCKGSEPMKTVPETDFIHFDHTGGALLIVFQSMTLEGWTDIMYLAQDSSNLWLATIFFFLLVFVTSFFLLNIALAVVDEARQDFDEDEEEQDMHESEGQQSQDLVGAGEVKLWLDNIVVYGLNYVATSEVFLNFIMLVIVANVVTMMIEAQHPPYLELLDFLRTCEILFLVVFCFEMAIMLGGVGPRSYVTNPVTAFDGLIVIASVISEVAGRGGPFTALRVLRLLRVLNKLAAKWRSFRVLMKAIVQTGISLSYWLVFFMLTLYIITLMSQELFARHFHFNDPDAFDEAIDQGELKCGDGTLDCIPRAHFDTFLWGFVTVFQIMTGENWNTIMYAGMRARGWYASLFFVIVILFGQTLILSLFLSMLMSKYDTVQDEVEKQEVIKMQKKKAQQQALRASYKKKKTRTLSEAEEAAKGTSEAQEGADGSVQKVVKHPSSQSQLSDDPMLPGQPADSNDATNQEQTPFKPSASQKNGERWSPRQDRDEERFSIGRASKELATSVQANFTNNVSGPVLNRPGWPNGYALFILHEENPLRRACEFVLVYETKICGTSMKVFDNFILFCILLSTLCMAVDYPLRDPDDFLTKLVREADLVFAVIFIIEMVLKLLARGFVWGPNAYLKSGWNWLDGTVVIVSVIGFFGTGNSGALKTLRILRAFRPLRVIAKNENLKVVVQTIFASMPDLFTLIVVSILFLLIVALVALSYLSGRLQACEDSDGMRFLQEPTENFVAPLCLRPGPWQNADVDDGFSACLRGAYDDDTGEWANATDAITGQPDCSECSSSGHTIPWQRASMDTPLCVGMCDPFQSGENSPPSEMCPPPLTSVDQVASMCPNKGTPEYEAEVTAAFGADFYNAEAEGETYVQKYMRVLVMPCGGTTVEEPSTPKDGVVSCREAFCPVVSDDRRESCKTNCEKHPYFCVQTCEADESSAACTSCRSECQAWCECEEFCGRGLINDAALCVEQGSSWSEVLSQNFNNIGEAMLTLFEISTTEGWVDVMYAAADSKADMNLQPERDNQELWAVFFSLYIFFSFMFIINLSVGVIVDKFMDLKQEVTTTLVRTLEERNAAGDQVIQIASQVGFTIDVGITIVDGEQEEFRRIKDMPRKDFVVLDEPLDHNFEPGAVITKRAEAVMSTKDQDKWKKRWQEARNTLEGRQMVYNIENLQYLPPTRRKVYDLVSSRLFENSIMLAILLNTVIMCMKVFPEPEVWWDDMLLVANYFFAAIFTLEAIVKLFALRLQYFRDGWNQFDFFCVVATLVGIVINEAGTGANLAAITSVIRIFRIARLFRLLRFLKGLNKIFMALLLSLPKLANVFMILMLMLTLYSILGVNLFSTMKQGDTFNTHGNFRNFLWGFVTLFRASTGEAWNEIMHDLMKDERQFYREGEWCTPAALFDPENHYDKLKSKCLVDQPNSCSGGPGPAQMMPVLFWITYTLVITFCIMNLVIAVILEGYEDGKPTKEGTTIDKCILLWRKYDPDQTMRLPLNDAMVFIAEVAGLKDFDRATVARRSVGDVPVGATKSLGSRTSMKELAMSIPMKYAKQLDLQPDEDGTVTFRQAAQQAIRLACFSDPEKAQEIDKDMAKNKSTNSNTFDIREDIAARKLQEVYRAKKERRSQMMSRGSTPNIATDGRPGSLPATLEDVSRAAEAKRASNSLGPKDSEAEELRQAGQGSARGPAAAPQPSLAEPLPEMPRAG